MSDSKPKKEIAPADTRRHAVPTVLQMEAVECGAASLAMVLGFYKRYVPLEELRLKCGVSRDGSKASNVLRAARGFGMTAKGFKKEPADLRAMRLPMIVFWNFNHFMVVEGFKNGKVYLNDPGSGPRVVTDDEFDQSFTGVVLTFEVGPEFQPGGQKPSVVEALKRRFAGLEVALSYLVLVGLALVIPGMLIPVFSSVFVDEFLVQGRESWLKPLLIGMGITAVARLGLTWLQSYYLLRVQTQLAMTSASKFFWHVLRMPVEFFTQRSPGEISSRVAINDRVAGLLTGELARAFLSVMTALFFVAMMFYYDVVLTLISIAVVSVNVVVLQLTSRKITDMSMRLAMDGGKLMGAAMNGLSIMETIKSSGSEGTFFSRLAGYQAKYVVSEQDVARVSLVMGALPGALLAINSALVIGIGGMRVIDGHLSIGMLVAYQSLVMSFIEPVNALVGLAQRLKEVQGDMNRLDDVLRYPIDPWTEQPLAPEAGSGRAAKMEGMVELRGVSFGYNKSDHALLEDFSLTVKPGQRVAIVGPSGCGKSTVSKLVTGLFGAWNGEILFDGRPRTAYSRYEFSNSVALVDQDIVLFQGSIRENLTLWDDTIPETDIIQAAKDACIHDVILARQGGYDSLVDEGGRNLSGGQRQRLELARALASNPRILVLDEATSALDSATEKQIDDNLRRRGCSCIIIAHRLSTIRDADEIIMLSFGQILERGTHDQLMAIEDGNYRRLVAQA
ncbi:MAG: NHLP family bacteriocin export ABC transporter peptidase/permease/ATPase subunit [Burkholderiales bacterium]